MFEQLWWEQLMTYRFLLLFFLSCVLTCSAAQAQTDTNAPANQSALQGVTEALMVDGQPALRIVTQKSGSTEILYQKRDNEDALVFPVVRFKKTFGSLLFGDTGKFYITRTRLIYDPDGDNENYFNVARAEFKTAVSEHHGRAKAAFNDALIKFQKDTKHFVLRFTEVSWANKSDTLPALEFFLRALNDFDSALKEFEQLTASVQPEAEEAEDEVAETDCRNY